MSCIKDQLQSGKNSRPVEDTCRNLSLKELSNENRWGNFTNVFNFLELRECRSGRISLPGWYQRRHQPPPVGELGCTWIKIFQRLRGMGGAQAKKRREVNNEQCRMSFCCHHSALYKPKCQSSYNVATCWEKYVPLAGKKCVGLECHIKPLKLALLSKLSQTQNKFNCVIYLIADENVVLFLCIQVACFPKRKHPFFFFFQVSFPSVRSWPCWC